MAPDPVGAARAPPDALGHPRAHRGVGLGRRFRSPDEQSLIDAAYDRARAAYESLQSLAQAAAQKNLARRMAVRRMINLGTYAPLAMPPAAVASATDLVRVLDAQAQCFAVEAQRIGSQLNDPADAPAAPRPLAPAPREVPPR